MATQILEETSFEYTATLKDENGDAVGSGDLDTLHLTVYNKSDKAIIRTTLNALNANGVTVDSDGNLTWSGRPYESQMSMKDSKAGTAEEHVALFEYTWNAESSEGLTDPFSTTLDSNVVTVNDTAHGLIVNDHVIFINAANAGGLEMDGLYIVKAITDADTFTVEHRTAATSTESGVGGSLTVFRNGKVGKFETTFEVVQADPV